MRGLADRDFEAQWFIWGVKARLNRRATLTGELETGDVSAGKQKIALKWKENGCHISARNCLVRAWRVQTLRPHVYCPTSHMRYPRRSHSSPARLFPPWKVTHSPAPRSAYRYTIQACANAGDIQNVLCVGIAPEAGLEKGRCWGPAQDSRGLEPDDRGL